MLNCLLNYVLHLCLLYICIMYSDFLENPPGVPRAPGRSTPSEEPTTPGGRTSSRRSEKLIGSSDLDEDLEEDLK